MPTRLNVISPEGEHWTIPAEKLQEALAGGFTQESDQQRQVREYVTENSGVTGQAKVFAGQAVDEFLMGAPETALDLTQDPLEKAKREALKKENALANTLGGLAGFAGSFVYGAPAAKLATMGGERLATAIATKAGGLISERAAATAAKSIYTKAASKFVGGVAEGAAFAAPVAITEGALGDRQLAGETLLYGGLAGGGISALIGGSAAGYRGVKKLAQKADTEAVRNWAAKTVTGVPKENIEAYISNPKLIDDAGEKGASALRLEINDGVAAVDEKLYIAQNSHDEAQRAYQNNVKVARVNLEKAKSTVDLDDVGSLQASLDEARGVLKKDSDDALEFLINNDVTVPRPKLLGYGTSLKNDLRLVDAQGNPTIELTDEVRDAVKNIDNLIIQIRRMPKEIDAATAKKTIQLLDSQISRPDASGAFFKDQTNKQLSRFRGFVDSFLKEDPAYAEAMKLVQEKAQALNELSKAGGTPEKAISFFKKAADAEKNPIQAAVLKRYDDAFKTDFGARLTENRRAIGLLDQYRVGGTEADRLLTAGLGDSDKALLVARDASEEALKTAKQNKSNVRGITDATSENLITRGGGLKEYQTEMLQSLAVQNGFPVSHYVDQVKNYRVWASFEKGSTQGSRKVTAFGATGAAIGAAGGPAASAFGAAVGAGIGLSVDVYGGQILKTILKNASGKGGVLAAENSMAKAGREISKIAGFLDDLASGKNRFAQTVAVAGALRLKGDRKAKAAQLEKLNENLSELSSNPDSLSGRIGILTGGLAENGAPNVAAAAASNMAMAVMYLQNSIPKPIAPTSPFAPKNVYMPTDAELSAFEQKLEIVQDPFTALGHFANGTLTSNHLDALNKVYPKIFSSMQRKIEDIGSKKSVKPLSYKNRIKLSMLIGSPIDATLGSVGFYQKSFQGEDKSIDPNMKASVNMSEENKTEVQRLA